VAVIVVSNPTVKRHFRSGRRIVQLRRQRWDVDGVVG
jgi:hypothetical protein